MRPADSERDDEERAEHRRRDGREGELVREQRAPRLWMRRRLDACRLGHAEPREAREEQHRERAERDHGSIGRHEPVREQEHRREVPDVAERERGHEHRRARCQARRVLRQLNGVDDVDLVLEVAHRLPQADSRYRSRCAARHRGSENRSSARSARPGRAAGRVQRRRRRDSASATCCGSPAGVR